MEKFKMQENLTCIGQKITEILILFPSNFNNKLKKYNQQAALKTTCTKFQYLPPNQSYSISIDDERSYASEQRADNERAHSVRYCGACEIGQTHASSRNGNTQNGGHILQQNDIGGRIHTTPY